MMLGVKRYYYLYIIIPKTCKQGNDTGHALPCACEIAVHGVLNSH